MGTVYTHRKIAEWTTYCAITSRPDTMGLIARCWMADGRSKPAVGWTRCTTGTVRVVMRREGTGTMEHALVGFSFLLLPSLLTQHVLLRTHACLSIVRATTPACLDREERGINESEERRGAKKSYSTYHKRRCLGSNLQTGPLNRNCRLA